MFANSFDAVDAVLRDYIKLQQKRTGPNLERMGEVIEGWMSAKALSEADNTQFGTLFNPFALASLKETLHSKILGELLNPRGSHGQGPLFLRCLLKHLKVPEPDAGEWQHAVEEDRVDLMLARAKPASVILIENKANNAVDQPNQLYRYWHRQIHCRFPPLDYQCPETRRYFRVIYLSADGRKMPEPHSLKRPNGWEGINRDHATLPLTWEPLGLDKLLGLLHDEASTRVPETNARLRIFIQMYSELWNL